MFIQKTKFKILILATILTLAQTQDMENILSYLNNAFEMISRQGRLLIPNFYGNFDGSRNSLYEDSTQTVEDDDSFDFIIVGSGSAGSVIANRLSEISKWKILVLEVGEEASILTDIPAMAPLFFFTDYNWNYLMEKQNNVGLGLVDQRLAWPRGRALGGSTIISHMIHIRGNPLDYDKWAKLGNPGWSYKEVLPYFKKSEDYHVKIQDDEYHSKGGYLTVEDVPYKTESANAFVAAAQEAGYPYVDYNGQSQLGVSYVHGTTRRGVRCSAEKAFLRPIRYRKNLKILTKARAVKIVIDPTTKTATGVQYVANKKYRIAKVRKEVILSAGAFNSPQLLMLSGIGPKDHLEELGIPVLQDLPVGQKLYDHLAFIGLAFSINESVVVDQNDFFQPNSLLELLVRGQGPLTSLSCVEALAYIKTNASKNRCAYPDVELIFLGGGLNTDKGQIFRKTFRMNDQIYNKVFKPYENKFVWQVFPMLLHPKSFGCLKLKSKNPYHWPKFYGNYFTDSDNQDMKTLIAAIREVQKIAAMPAMQRYGSKLITIPIPGCEEQIFDSDEYWECALRSISLSLYHQVATCKMGPKNDPEAVVNNELKVYGVKNLRVADTSVIPIPLAAHTDVPAYMVGEKASDLIKAQWLKAR